MSVQDLAFKEMVPHERIAEAAVWIARLHGDERDPGVEAGFRRWLQAHPLNSRAFELATDVWEEAEGLRRALPPTFSTSTRPRGRFLSPWITALAAAVLIVIGIFLYLPTRGVTTQVGEQRLLTLEDGSRIFLNTSTRVFVKYDRKVRRVEVRFGEAMFEVAKRPDWPFIVTAGDRQVKALGTSFVVRREDQRISVTLVEGKVTVSPTSLRGAQTPAILPMGNAPVIGASQSGGDVFTLSPGQRLTFTGHAASQLDTPPLDVAIAWRRGHVVLDDTALGAAVAEMNRYSATKLVIEQHEAGALIVNGLFQVGDSISFANAVAQTYELKVIDKGNTIVLSGIPKTVASSPPSPKDGESP